MLGESASPARATSRSLLGFGHSIDERSARCFTKSLHESYLSKLLGFGNGSIHLFRKVLLCFDDATVRHDGGVVMAVDKKKGETGCLGSQMMRGEVLVLMAKLRSATGDLCSRS